jgi:hypothetical protein
VRDAKTHWTSDIELFDSALEALVGTLRVFRPHVAAPLTVAPPEIGAPELGIVQEAQAADPARPLSNSTKRHRAAVRLKEDLGQELVDRALRHANEEHPQGVQAPEEKKS